MNSPAQGPSCSLNARGSHPESFWSAARKSMMLKKVRAAVVATVVLSLIGDSIVVQAAENRDLSAEIRFLSREWEHIKLQVDNRDEQEKQMVVLAQHAADITQRYQGSPEATIWVGIITSEQASMASDNGSPIKALVLAKRARDILEKVEKIDPVTLDAAAPTSLGVLYYRVPEFPLGFGDKSKARHYLQEAITNAPNGLDANYFYGDFLYNQHEYPEAIKVLKRAITLPALLERPIWDRSRRLVIKELLSKMQSDIKN
jgi:tetratricopeptide (TPR) repeat protein